ncbi:MAG: T9SS type A sorting domain-containing protein [Balneola sp.]
MKKEYVLRFKGKEKLLQKFSKSVRYIMLVFILILIQKEVFAQFAGGDGSSGDPYQITNLTELNEVRNYGTFGNHFILMNDIDARDTKNWNNGQGWEPMGTAASPNWYRASFDGNGHVIYGLYINRTGTDNVGLFGYITGGSNVISVKNLGLVDVDITGDEYVGALAGNLNGIVEHVFSTGEVKGRNHTGGLIGTMLGGSVPNVNYSYSHAKTSSSNYGASGLVARQQGGAILKSFSTGAASAPNGVGGLVGEQNSGTVTDSFWDTETSGLATSAGQATGKTTSEMQTQSTFSGAGWDFSSNWEITDVYNFGYPMHQITKKYGGGSGTSGDPYLIKNTFHLRNIYDSNTYEYKLVHDIDLNIYPFNSGKGWKPIGTNSSGQEFHGRFDGNGKKIKNLYINRPTENFVGLFGTTRYGYIKKVGFEDANVTGKDYVGIITGINYTHLSESYSTGSVTAENHAGGLAGLLENYTSSGEISNSYSLATVSATSSSAGGLIGRFLSGDIGKSYAAGTVSAPSNVGGVVGQYQSGTVANDVFWDTTATGQTSSSGGGVAKTLIQLKTKSTFTDTNWNFSSVWNIVTGDSTSYPYLQQAEQTTPPGKQYKLIDYAGGQGTIANPYLISTPQQLDSIRYHLTAHFKLISNLEMDVAPYNSGEGWSPIGTNSSGEEFSGSLDGDGFKVQNLFINRPSTNFVGVFGATKHAVIKNIGVEDVNVKGKEYTGALVGINYSEVRNSYSSGSVKGFNHTGGLVGGLETWDGSTALVINSYSTASAYSSNFGAGGLVGRQLSGTIEHSYAVGEATVISGNGGLIGEKNTGTVTNSYWNNEFLCQESSAGGTELSVSQLKQQDSFSGWDFSTVWNIDENNSFPYLRNNEQVDHPDTGQSANIKLFGGGCGTETKPYQIGTAVQLDSVRYQRDKYFIQTANIDLNVAPFNSGEGWLPIENYFEGSYNGNGFQILNLFINRPGTNLVGLFARINSNATLKNMKIDSVDVTGRDYTGILAGQIADSDITNVNVSGSVVGNYDTGGLSGYSFRTDIDSSSSNVNITMPGFRGGGLIGRTNYGNVTNSHSSGSISGRGEVGGLIGNGTYTNISQSYSETEVTANNSYYAGGFIGFGNRTTISNSYAVGSVTTNSNYIAGFAGRTYSGSITDSYSGGKVTGVNSSALGFISYRQGTSVNNSYWNTETSTRSSSNGGVGLTTKQMKDQSSFNGWDFSDVWGIQEHYAYPYLKNNEQTPHPGYEELKELLGGGFGIESNPYKVATAVHLDSVRYFMDTHFIQVADIDMNEAPFNQNSGWDPIGTNGSGNEFSGTYDGNGFKISNLFIDRNSSNFTGLFGATHSAVLKNIALENVDITGDEYTGALVGINYSEVRNSYSTGTVNGYNHTGGLIGATENYNGSNGLVTNSYSTASATSSNYGASALVARLKSGTIEYSYGTGSVSAPSGNGGLIGEKSSGTVTNSYWDTETTGQSSSADGTGLTTAQMKQRNSFSGFDFTDTWYIEEGSGYPKLQETKYNELIITGAEGWRMLSSPVSGASFGTLLDSLWTQGFTGADVSHGNSNVYTWSESARSFQPITNANEVPASGIGFLTFVYSDDDNDGNPEGFPKKLINSASKFNGQASPSVSFTDSGVMANDGWNLVGNPYGTSINWGAQSGWNKKNIDATYYVWSDSANNGNGSYLSWNGITGTLKNGMIAPWQGFWIKAHSASPEFSINDSTKNSGGNLMKVSEASTIKLKAKSDDMSSQAVVLFYKDAVPEKDQYDAYKLQPLSSEYLSLFSSFPLEVDEENTQLDINALPDHLSGMWELPVDVDLSISDTSKTQTEITLSWELNKLPESWSLILFDQQEDEQYDLNDVAEITFDVNHEKRSKSIDVRNLIPIQRGGPEVMKSKSVNESRFILQISAGEAVSYEEEAQLPVTVELSQNYPNPFNPTTTIGYGVPENGEVTLEVFDVIGRKVATLMRGEHKTAGRYTINFDASNLASGMYIYRLQAGSSVITKKLTLIK